MTRRELEARQQFETSVMRKSDLQWHEARDRARLLLRHGVTYMHLQEDACNGCGTYYGEDAREFSKRQDAFEARRTRKEELLEKRIAAIAAELNPRFAVKFEGDPRGHTIRLVLGEEEISVPTS